MLVPHQVAEQRPVVGDLFRAVAVADSGGLDNRRIVSHDIDETDVAAIKNLKFPPPERFNQCLTLLGHFYMYM